MIRRPLRRAFSYSERHELLRALGEARSLALQCAQSESNVSELRNKCESLCTAVDVLATELTGDATHFHMKMTPARPA